MGEEHRINEIKGVIISRALLKEYGYDGDMPTDKQLQQHLYNLPTNIQQNLFL